MEGILGESGGRVLYDAVMQHNGEEDESYGQKFKGQPIIIPKITIPSHIRAQGVGGERILSGSPHWSHVCLKRLLLVAYGCNGACRNDALQLVEQTQCCIGDDGGR